MRPTCCCLVTGIEDVDAGATEAVVAVPLACATSLTMLAASLAGPALRPCGCAARQTATQAQRRHLGYRGARTRVALQQQQVPWCCDSKGDDGIDDVDVADVGRLGCNWWVDSSSSSSSSWAWCRAVDLGALHHPRHTRATWCLAAVASTAPLGPPQAAHPPCDQLTATPSSARTA